ncbi:MAG: hypothetical protein NC548_46145 [Lachnospiraceae bacterium]|nr:hypothetical protein [Lachnospiraceae bacterium]
MDARKFFDTVAAMRKSQKAYFKFKLQRDLSESKRLEMIVDKEIERVNSIIGVEPSVQQPQPASLFGD